MKLEDLLDVINPKLEFELYVGDRIGIFCTEDKGLREYFNREINEILIEEKRLIICLD